MVLLHAVLLCMSYTVEDAQSVAAKASVQASSPIWCAAAACCRSLTPDPETLAAIAAASSGGAPPVAASSSSSGMPCCCSLCAAAQEACGCAAGPAGRFFGGGLCSQGSCCADNAPAGSPSPSPVHFTAKLAAPAAPEASRDSRADGLPAAGAAGSSSAAAPAAKWWQQGRCQLQFAVLLLLSVANISVSVEWCLLGVNRSATASPTCICCDDCC
jgi:hypothetical protein